MLVNALRYSLHCQRPATLGNGRIRFPHKTQARQRRIGDRARDSCVWPSATMRPRKQRPSVKMSLTKSELQHWFGQSGTSTGRLVPRARLRPRPYEPAVSPDHRATRAS